MRSLVAWLAAVLFAASAANAAEPVVIGYVPAFKGFDAVVDRANFRHYTHVDLAFVNPGPSGEIIAGDQLACAPAGDGTMVSEARLRNLIANAHNSGAKLLASVGGGTIPPCAGDWAALARPESRGKVIAGLVDFVDRYGLDGIDVDLEGELMTRMDQEGSYTPFVKELAAALHSRSRLLTCATASYVGGMVPDAALPYFDLIGIMSYDAIGPTWGTPGDEHASYAQAEADLRLWLGKGVPAAKLALGLPFYGRGFGQYRPNWTLAEIKAEMGGDAMRGDVVGQRCGGCSYITFNGLPTLERKARLAGAWGAGVMVWEVDQDLPGHKVIRKVRKAVNEGREYAR
jgi:GH18 family chitinase